MHAFDDQVIADMTDGGVDRSVECTGSIQAMISAFECVHDVITFTLWKKIKIQIGQLLCF